MQNLAKLRNDSAPFFPREMRFCNAVQNSANSLGSIISLIGSRLTVVSCENDHYPKNKEGGVRS
jgi:hypothetical protein